MIIAMGNRLSPWMFCLAIDPLVRRIHGIPVVQMVNAYMDDLQTGSWGFKALCKVQLAIDSFAKISGLL